mmetsp:Transcript_12619/g.28638  ORF Transcript_12619/g.28638 Transcript_12619/m.28638 type:complete len:239 (-) Transcript_12619:183-899(-)
MSDLIDFCHKGHFCQFLSHLAWKPAEDGHLLQHCPVLKMVLLRVLPNDMSKCVSIHAPYVALLLCNHSGTASTPVEDGNAAEGAARSSDTLASATSLCLDRSLLNNEEVVTMLCFPHNRIVLLKLKAHHLCNDGLHFSVIEALTAAIHGQSLHQDVPHSSIQCAVDCMVSQQMIISTHRRFAACSAVTASWAGRNATHDRVWWWCCGAHRPVWRDQVVVRRWPSRTDTDRWRLRLRRL